MGFMTFERELKLNSFSVLIISILCHDQRVLFVSDNPP